MGPIARITSGLLVGATALLLLSSAAGRVRVEQLAARLSEPPPPPVAVVVVDDPRLIAAVRAAVDESRVLQATPSGLVLREGRILATSYDSASTLIQSAGWVGRDIQIGLRARPATPRSAHRLPELPAGWTTGLLAALALAGTLVALSGSRTLWHDWIWRRRLRPFEPPVVVLPVADAEALAEIRAGLPSGRILAERNGAFAVAGDWIVTSGNVPSSGLLRAAGWRHRRLDVHRPDPFGSNTARSTSEPWELEPEPSARSRCFTPQQALGVLGRGNGPEPVREPIDLPPDEPGEACWQSLARV